MAETVLGFAINDSTCTYIMNRMSLLVTSRYFDLLLDIYNYLWSDTTAQRVPKLRMPMNFLGSFGTHHDIGMGSGFASAHC